MERSDAPSLYNEIIIYMEIIIYIGGTARRSDVVERADASPWHQFLKVLYKVRLLFLMCSLSRKHVTGNHFLKDLYILTLYIKIY